MLMFSGAPVTWTINSSAGWDGEEPVPAMLPGIIAGIHQPPEFKMIIRPDRCASPDLERMDIQRRGTRKSRSDGVVSAVAVARFTFAPGSAPMTGAATRASRYRWLRKAPRMPPASLAVPPYVTLPVKVAVAAVRVMMPTEPGSAVDRAPPA